MAHRILIPTPLRPFAGKLDVVEVDGGTVGEILQALVGRYGDLRKHLYTDEGKLRSFVNIYVNDEDIRHLEREKTALKAGDTVSIVPSVAGGVGAVVQREGEELSREEIQRYSRHLIMPEVGVEGQRKLKAARVLCIGAGGLGAPASMYLAAAGVGTLGTRRFRQGRCEQPAPPDHLRHAGRRPAKARGLARSPAAMNPSVKVVLHEVALTSKNALDVLRDYDVILDGTDNFPDPLSGQRRVRAARQAERVRQHLQVRRAGVRVRGQGRPVLSLPLSRSRHRRVWSRAAPRAACWACCRASSASSRPRKQSS